MVRRLGISLELHTELPVGGVRNMTVSWRRRLASISGAAGGGFDDGVVVDRRDWLAVGWPPDGRSWYPARLQFRQYPDPLGYGRGLHRDDHAQPLGGRSGAEEHRVAAWLCRFDGNARRKPGKPRRPAESGSRRRRFLVQPRPAGIGRCRRCGRRPRRHPRSGGRRPRRAIAARPRRFPPRPRQPSSRGAICCFPRHRGKNASALRGERAIPSEADLGPVPASESGEVSPPTFDDAWPKPERPRAAEAPPQRRGGRAPSAVRRSQRRCGSLSAGRAK